MGSYGGRVLYEKWHANPNPTYKQYLRWVDDRWEFTLIHYFVRPGMTVWGETIGDLDFSTPG